MTRTGRGRSRSPRRRASGSSRGPRTSPRSGPIRWAPKIRNSWARSRGPTCSSWALQGPRKLLSPKRFRSRVLGRGRMCGKNGICRSFQSGSRGPRCSSGTRSREWIPVINEAPRISTPRAGRARGFSPTAHLWRRRAAFLLVAALAGTLLTHPSLAPSASAQEEMSGRSEQALRTAREQSDRKDFEGAAATLRAALREDPENKEMLSLLARVLAWSRHFDESIQTYRKLLAKYPDDALDRAGYARVLAWSGRSEAAIPEFRRAIEQDSTDLEARIGYARALSWDGDLGEPRGNSSACWTPIKRTGTPGWGWRPSPAGATRRPPPTPSPSARRPTAPIPRGLPRSGERCASRSGPSRGPDGRAPASGRSRPIPRPFSSRVWGSSWRAARRWDAPWESASAPRDSITGSGRTVRPLPST